MQLGGGIEGGGTWENTEVLSKLRDPPQEGASQVG